MNQKRTKAELLTELEQAQKRIAALEAAVNQKGDARFASLFRASPFQMALTDSVTGKYVEVNEVFLRSLGFERDEVLGKTALELNLFDNPAQRAELLQRMAAQGCLREELVRVRAKTGEIRQGIFSAEYVQVNGQQFLLTMMNDITARVNTEAKLRESEERFRSFIEQSADGFMLTNEQGVIIEWNQALSQITGLPREQALEMTIWELQKQLTVSQKRARLNLEQLKQAMIEILRSGQSPFLGKINETEIQTQAGDTKFIQQTSFLIPTAQGYRIGAVIRDVTERKQMENELEAESVRRRILFEESPDGILVIDPQTAGFVEFNPQAHIQLGYTREEFAKLHIFDVEVQETATETRQHIDDVVERGRSDFETLQRTKQGEVRNVHVTAQIVSILGKPVYYCTWRDTTEQTHAEATIRNRNRTLLALHNVMLDLVSELRLPVLLSNILKQAQALMEADRGGGIYFYVPGQNVLRLEYGSGINQGREGVEIKIGEGVSGYVYQTSQPLIVNDYTKWEGHTAILVSDPPSAVLGVPLFLNGKMIGILTLIANSLLRKFAETDLQQAEMFAAQATVAIQNARLYEQAIQEIGVRKQADEKLRESEARFHGTLDVMQEGVLLIGRDWRYLYINKSAEIQGRRPVDELLGKTVMECWPGVEATEFFHLEQKVMQEHQPAQLEGPFTFPDGERHWFHWNIQPTAEGLLVVTQDITERKQAEEKLRESEERFRTVADFTYDMEYWLNENKQLEYMSPACQRITGRDRNEFLQNPALLETIIHPADREKYEQHFKNDFESPEAASLDFRIITANGEERWINHTCQGVNGKDGRWRGRRVSNRDITKRKSSEDKVRESEEKYRLLVETAKEGIWSMDREHLTTYVNQAMADMLGYEPGEMLGRKVEEFFFKEDMEFHQERMQIRHAGHDESYERRFRRRDGSSLWTQVSARVLKDAQGNFDGSFAMFTDINERKRADEKLRESEERFQQIADHIGEVVWMFDHREQKLIYLNAAYEKVWGISIAETYQDSQKYIEAIHPADREVMFAALARQAEGASVEMEYRVVRPDGSTRWIYDRSFPIFGEGGRLIRTTGVAADITERKQAELQLRASEEKYRGLMESLDAVVSMFDADGRLIYLNEVAASQFGGTVGEMVGKTMSELFPEPVAARQLASIRRVIAEDRSLTIEARSVIQGQPRWYRNSIQPIHDEDGGVMYVLVNATDIHELKTIQQELQELNRTLEERVKERTAELEAIRQRLELATQTAKLGVWEWNIKTGQLLWDKQVYAIYGLSEETFQVSMETFLALVYPEDVVSLVQFSQAAASNQLAGQVEYRVMRGDGMLGYVKFDGAIRCDTEGQPESVIGVVQDITSEKLAEKNLRESEERYRKAISAAGAVPYNLDYRTNTYTFLGEGIEKITGYGRDELTPSLFDKIIEQTSMQGDLSRLSTEVATRQVRAGEAAALQAIWRSDFRIRKKNGEVSWLSDSSVQILERQGAPGGSIGILQDITERKRAEEALQRANLELARAMRMKDEFLANMSHELRTPLNGILGLSEALQLQTYGVLSEKQLRALKNIESSGKHLLSLINDILDLSKIEAGKLEIHVEPVLVAGICQASLAFIKEPAIKKGVSLNFAADSLVITVLADQRRLKQILVNLLSNAVKFTPTGGNITLQVQADLRQRMVDFSVSDTGIGIAPEDLARLFNPFTQVDSSLTRQHEGTGLGLALVKELTEMHGGCIRVTSEVGQGSTFTISLPWQPETVDQEPVSAAGQAEAGTAPAQGTPKPLETILLAEDVELNIMTIGDFLESQGYNMIYALNGREALEKARKNAPALILMDIQMPIMDGLEATRQLRADPQFATVPIIALTAMAMNGDSERCLAAGANTYVSKPVGLKQLVETIRALLEQKA